MVSSGYIPTSGIAGSYGGFIPSFLRNFHAIFQSGCTNSHPHQQCKKVPFSPHPLQHLLFVDFWWWPFWLVWGDISLYFYLHFSNNERCWASFHVLISICMSSLEKCLFRSFYHFLIGLFVFLELSCMSFLYILESNPLSVVSFAIIFSHSESCLFTWLIVSFSVQKLLSLIRSHFLLFFFSLF